MNKKSIWWIVGVVVVILVIVGVSSNRKVAEKQIIKIGLVTPLTGNVAFLGEGMRNAVQMAERELASTTGNKYKYQILIEDDAFDPKKTASSVNKLINIDKVSALITIASAAGNVASPIAEKSQVIHFGIASDPNVAKGNLNFIHWTPPYEETKVFVPELVKRGYKNVAILGAQIQGVFAVIESFKKDIQGTNVKIANEQIFDFGTKDFRTILAKAQVTKPDIYIIFAFSPELEIIVKQMKEAGIKTPITSIESFEQSNSPETFEGSWYVNGADTTGAFIDSYSKIFNKSPSLGSANAYDIVKLIATAAEKVDSRVLPTSAEIATKLYTIKDVQGALGNLSIDGDGFVASKAVVRMIKDGKPVTITQ